MVTVRKRQGGIRTNELTNRLQGLSARRLSGRWPSLPADHALRDWSTTLGILDDVR